MANLDYRIVKQSLDSLELRPAPVAALAAPVAVAKCLVASIPHMAAAAAAAPQEVAVVRSTLPTFVTPLANLDSLLVVDVYLASIQHWLARFEGPVPTSRYVVLDMYLEVIFLE